MNLDTARNGTQTKCKMCNPAVWVPIFRKHRVSHLVHNNNGNVIWFHLHASIRSTLEFIRLTTVFSFPRLHSCESLRHWVCLFFYNAHTSWFLSWRRGTHCRLTLTFSSPTIQVLALLPLKRICSSAGSISSNNVSSKRVLTEESLSECMIERVLTKMTWARSMRQWSDLCT